MIARDVLHGLFDEHIKSIMKKKKNIIGVSEILILFFHLFDWLFPLLIVRCQIDRMQNAPRR